MADFAAYLYIRLRNVINTLKPMHDEVKGGVARINQQTELAIQMGELRLAQQMNAQTNAVISGFGGSMAEAWGRWIMTAF